MCFPHPPPLPSCTLLSGISRQGNASVIPSGVLILPPELNALEHQVMQIFCFPCAKSGQRNLYAQSGLIVMGKTPYCGTVSIDHIFTLSKSKHTFPSHKREQGRNHLSIKLPLSVGCQTLKWEHNTFDTLLTHFTYNIFEITVILLMIFDYRILMHRFLMHFIWLYYIEVILFCFLLLFLLFSWCLLHYFSVMHIFAQSIFGHSLETGHLQWTLICWVTFYCTTCFIMVVISILRLKKKEISV